MKKIEKKLHNQGFSNLAGLDEVGRGCWAGPLVVAICMFDKEYENYKIKDSKTINESERKKVYDQILKDALLVDWVIYDSNFVDKHNPKKTSIIGMEYLINIHKDKIDYCLIDAEKVNVSIPSKSIIKGDSLCQSIAAASIVAKVIRDEMMKKIDIEYPEYKFKSNKGYGTKDHREALEKLGPIKNVHRFSYKPIQKILDNLKKE